MIDDRRRRRRASSSSTTSRASPTSSSMALRYEHFDVQVAHSGREALDAVRGFAPDLVVLDVMMPGIDGFEVARRLRNDGSQPPDPLPHRARRDRGQGARPHPRRRRLHDQAVQRRGARGAHPRDPAARAAGRRCAGPARLRRPRARRGHPRGAGAPATRSSSRPPSSSSCATCMLNARRVLSKDQILDHVWNYDFGGNANIVETYISYLRRKIDAVGPAAHPDGARRRLQHPPAQGDWDRLSLRTRLLLALLGLVAVGLLVAGVGTYTSLRSFLLERVDQQLREARGPVAMALASSARCPGSGRARRPRPAQPAAGHLRRSCATPTGTVLNSDLVRLRPDDDQPTPELPSPLPGAAGDGQRDASFTTGAAGGRDAPASACSCSPCRRRRARPRSSPSRSPRPARRSAASLGIEVLVSRSSCSRRSRAAAWLLIKRDLRPLETMAETADAIAAGDLSQRVRAGRAAHRSRPARPQPQRDARPDRGGLRGARRHRGQAAALPRRRLARAAHAAHQHPRLRRGVRARRQGRPRGPRHGDAPHRGGEQAHGRDGRRAARAGAARRGPAAGARAGRPRARRERRRRRRARRRRRSATSRSSAPDDRGRDSATTTSSARSSPTCSATRAAHAGGHARSA